MRKLVLLFATCFLAIGSVHATTNHRNTTDTPFVFIENNVEYAVFKNGDFDFNIINNYRSRVNVNTSFINFSFNTGHNYAPYIERNRYGDITQINRTPIFYDYKGRVSQIGNINVNYNRYGFVNSIGSLNVIYHSNGVYNRSIGMVNLRNRHYTPYCKTYTHPRVQRKIIKNRVAYNTTSRYNRSYTNTPRKAVQSNRYYKQKSKIKQQSKENSKNKYNKKVEKKKSTKTLKKQKDSKTQNANTVTYSKRTNSNSYRRQ